MVTFDEVKFFVKVSETQGGAKTHLLDYDPRTLLSLKSIVNETMPDVELVENLVGKFLEANHSK